MAQALLGPALLVAYLIAFAIGTNRAARLKGGRVWLFGQARGRDRLAALGFRAAFVLALLGPFLPGPHPQPPLFLVAIGLAIALLGALIAGVAQWQMGASWRVGVAHGSEADPRIDNQIGALITTGLFRHSRNPTFIGQALLLAGTALAAPSLPGGLAPVMFLASAQMQILREEQALAAHHGAAFARWCAATPRWLGHVQGGGEPEVKSARFR